MRVKIKFRETNQWELEGKKMKLTIEVYQDALQFGRNMKKEKYSQDIQELEWAEVRDWRVALQ